VAEDTEKIRDRKPFKTRLISSMIIWLIIAFIVGNIGFFAWMMPKRGEFELRGAKLPPLAELTLAEGNIINMGYYISRRTQFINPTIEFQSKGRSYQFRAVDAYQPHLFPFQQNQKVEVLFVANEPEKAWLKWEYERLTENYQGFSVLLLGETIWAYYFYFASILLGLSGLILIINLFVPIFRFLPINK